MIAALFAAALLLVPFLFQELSSRVADYFAYLYTAHVRSLWDAPVDLDKAEVIISDLRPLGTGIMAVFVHKPGFHKWAPMVKESDGTQHTNDHFVEVPHWMQYLEWTDAQPVPTADIVNFFVRNVRVSMTRTEVTNTQTGKTYMAIHLFFYHLGHLKSRLIRLPFMGSLQRAGGSVTYTFDSPKGSVADLRVCFHTTGKDCRGHHIPVISLITHVAKAVMPRGDWALDRDIFRVVPSPFRD